MDALVQKVELMSGPRAWNRSTESFAHVARENIFQEYLRGSSGIKPPANRILESVERSERQYCPTEFLLVLIERL